MTMHPTFPARLSLPTFSGPMSLPAFPETRREMLARVTVEVAARHGVLPHLISGPGRERPVAHARQDVYLALSDAWWPVHIIAKMMGRDPATVVYGIRKAAERRVEA